VTRLFGLRGVSSEGVHALIHRKGSGSTTPPPLCSSKRG